jgi:hypothetical protein
MRIPSTIVVLVVVTDIIRTTTLHRFRKDARTIERRRYQGRRRRRCRFLRFVTNGRGRRRREGGGGPRGDRPTAHRPRLLLLLMLMLRGADACDHHDGSIRDQ